MNTIAADQGGLNTVIKIQINGQNVGAGNAVLRVNGGDSTIRGLAIYGGPSDGIRVTSATNDITGNFIGTDAERYRNRYRNAGRRYRGRVFSGTTT